MIRLGVVGHRGYDGLADLLRTLVRLAPELGIEPYFENDLHELAGEGEPARVCELQAQALDFEMGARLIG